MGIDLGKKRFHLFGVDESGSEVLKKKPRRMQLLGYFVNLPPCLMGIEACSVLRPVTDYRFHLGILFSDHLKENLAVAFQFFFADT